jgi:UDP-N-acetylmuramoyl-tripeptide--D-alanyl-D-alanine ligase
MVSGAAVSGVPSASFALDEVLAATSGELAALGAHARFAGVTTDSRAVRPGEVFVAICGDTHDGHGFVPDAVSRGAGAVVVERGYWNERTAGSPAADLGCTVVVVRDSLAALGDLAGFHRRRHRPRVVAITGSNGKTTTKEMLAAILERAFGPGRVLRTLGTQNNLVGLPLTLLRLGDEEQAAILELGMNGPGEIWRLAEIALPDVGVITCVAPAHLEGLGSVHGVAEAKAELYRRLRPSAVAVVNADDPLVAASARAFPGRKVAFATDAATVPDAVVFATDVVDHGLEGTEFRLVMAGAEARVRLAVPGRHNVSNALAAAAVAHALDVGLEAVRSGLEAFQPPGMRMEVTQLPSGVTVLNDAYNANPASMAAALRTLAASRGRRRLAALGEMRELGAESDRAHRELGVTAAATNLDGLFLLGDHAEAVRAGAETAGMPPERIHVARSHDALAADLRAACRPGDLLLLKGSRGAAMEEVLRRLASEAPGESRP